MPGVKGRSGGHNRKPVAQHLAEGTYRAHRHGPAATITKPKGKLRKPDGLTDRQSAIWDELESMLPPGVAGEADSIAFAMFVTWYGLWKDATRSPAPLAVPAQRSALIASGDRVRHYLTDFGMLPMARERMGLNAPTDDGDVDPLKALAERRKAAG